MSWSGLDFEQLADLADRRQEAAEDAADDHMDRERPGECPWCGTRPYDDCHDEVTGATGSYDPWGAA